ncbi:MAG: hypothetical protein KKF65_05390, partial [Nanoarchaeota archaeon]|nr:hypothetical protein [Nanoarchaeota archaeon]
MFKRGQQPAATSAGILIIIIAVILVMYILFLPPEERADLLGEENETSGVGLTESGYNKTLLEENIGRLDYLSFDYREHDIPSFRIYSEKQGTVLKSLSSIYVTHNIGNKKSYNVSFQVDKKYSSNTFLSFNVKESRGRLEIYLNGREIFNGVLDDGSPLPIELPKDVLESKNNLMFKASNPGIVFWKNNEYLLENVLITADVLDVSNSVSRQFFYLSDV